MKQHPFDCVVRRWRFYSGSGLAFGGEARQTDTGEIRLRIVETEQHAHGASLPERIGLEQKVREQVRSDIEQVMGPDALVSIQFERPQRAEELLAKDIFG